MEMSPGDWCTWKNPTVCFGGKGGLETSCPLFLSTIVRGRVTVGPKKNGTAAQNGTNRQQKTAIAHRNKEKKERRKTDAKRNNVSTIQALGGRENPFVAIERQSSSSSRGIGVDIIVVVVAAEAQSTEAVTVAAGVR
jgi:hypothetical protein